MRSLPLTLVAYNGNYDALTVMAIADTLKIVTPKRFVLASPVDLGFSGLSDEWLKLPFVDVVQAQRDWWYAIPEAIDTSHYLTIHYDAWVIDAEMWDDEFLAYDYIGSPWWHTDGMNVGNGSACIRSMRLMRFLGAHQDEFPMLPSEDNTLCRIYRRQLESRGFRWAPEPLASRFAFECTRPYPGSRHFMFHGVMNWPNVLSAERHEERMKVLRNARGLTLLDNRYRPLIAPRLCSEMSS